MTRKALINGGSIGGLFAAAALQRAGWDTEVFERTPVELSGRGAGIVTHPPLIEALRAVGVDLSDLGVPVSERLVFDQAGAVVGRLEMEQIVTSWDRVHSGLRRLIAPGRYHAGANLVGFSEEADGVTARFEDGSERRGDVLIGADGFRSAVRAQLAPEVQPRYAGYVVWRTLAAESALPQALRDQVFGAFGLYLPDGLQFVGYPIAGPGNDLTPGARRYNFVWYLPVPEAELDEMLTDASGQRHSLSIPPPLVREEVVARMMAVARARLAKPFVQILELAEKPFFTPIYDHLSPRFAAGRVALSGDAACVARPHVGMGVTKAAEDALALARHLGAGSDVVAALAAYSAERRPAAERAWARSQSLGALIAGDGRNPHGACHPAQERILRETAVMVD